MQRGGADPQGIGMTSLVRQLAGHVACLVALGISAPTARADQVVLAPAKDSSLFSYDGDRSNGIGEYLFSGRTDSTFGLRRALIAFDIAGNVPAGSTIDGVSLQLHCSMSAPGSGPRTHVLRRVLSDWGEAGSDAGDPGGFGASAMPGDATWTHRFWNTTPWTTLGGDFIGDSATASIDGVGFYTWSSATMTSNVQSWLDSPVGNFGWILIGDETAIQTAKRIDSRENVLPANRPMLTVDFTPPVVTFPGRVPEGSLVISKSAPGMLQLSWDASCSNGAADYQVYVGDLIPPFDQHLPMLCSTSTNTFSPSFSEPSSSAYFLIVPASATDEGSYGLDSTGNERPISPSPCLPQDLASCN
jgi:hypothetical protein